MNARLKFWVEIFFAGHWRPLDGFETRADAEWAIARWRQQNGCNGKDTGFRVSFVERGYGVPPPPVPRYVR